MIKGEMFSLYNNTVHLMFDEIRHIYNVKGKRVEGVTGVTGIIAKPALMYWSVKMAIEYLEENLKPGKVYDELEIKKLLDAAKMAHRIKKTDAGDLGTLVHEAIETFIRKNEITKLVNPVAKASFEQFIKWATDNKVTFTESERKIYSKKFNYAGTMDFFCEKKGKSFVGDTKTGSAIYDEMWFQTSAYQQAYQEETGTKVDGQIIVRVGKDGSLEVKENYDYEKNVVAFNGALVLYRRIQELNDIKNGKTL